ncbi:hypothetical protein ACFPJ1_26730 [Kribbella qitaiheensis]|uniref:hypothetical protein n=1 Tax=Kribbella qitaiheensis TaxID=1544730 RepID=UPI003613C5C6
MDGDGSVLAVGGAYSAPGAGPFPEDGLIPFLQPLYDYSWVVGLIAGFLAYLALTLTSPIREPTATHAAPTT